MRSAENGSVGAQGGEKILMKSPPIFNIFFIGFMGTGKSVTGKKLADRLRWTYCDIDTLIEQRLGQSISAVFQEHGEALFRSEEKAVIAELAQGKYQVISTGGGAVLDPDNRRVMARSGLVIHLDADPDTIVERVRHGNGRPLLAGANVGEKVRALLKQRKGLYDFADMQISTDQRTVEETVSLIVDCIAVIDPGVFRKERT
jgi:shikimate kinase